MNEKEQIPDIYCASLTCFGRRASGEVRIGGVTIGGGNPVAVQTMTDTDTNDTEACLAQIGSVRDAGCRIVRLTAQGVREGENLRNIAAAVKLHYPDVALVADVHFMPEVALVAADSVDKVRINPGNYNDSGGDFDALLDKCAARGVALRIGVNHGSLDRRIVEQYGDSPRGMVVSAMEFLRRCTAKGFRNVVVSMKSSNTRVMVHAYRMLSAAMAAEGMDFPIHLGVTEAGSGIEGRVKSAAGIGALMADGIGDTIRVSLTEPPRNEIPVAKELVEYFAERERSAERDKPLFDCHANNNIFSPYAYARRQAESAGRVGGGSIPLLYTELDGEERAAIADGRIAVLTARGDNPVGEWRAALMRMTAEGDRRPVILHRCYPDATAEQLTIRSAADFGVMFIDGVADGIWIEGPAGTRQQTIDDISLNILQASRARMSRTEFIACPGCGRTLFGLQQTLADIKSRMAHLPGLKIGVMGCIVNGPGEMADADYGYVGAAPGHITLYRGKTPVRKNIPQEQALGELVALLKEDGKWREQ